MQEATPEQEQATPAETLDPDTPEARQVFAKLAANAQAKGHRGPRRFPSLECKRSFLEAAATLGHAACLEAVDKALGQGITALPRLVAYVAAVADKKTRPTVIHLGKRSRSGGMRMNPPKAVNFRDLVHTPAELCVVVPGLGRDGARTIQVSRLACRLLTVW